jgi:hypothetical protein
MKKNKLSILCILFIFTQTFLVSHAASKNDENKIISDLNSLYLNLNSAGLIGRVHVTGG